MLRTLPYRRSAAALRGNSIKEHKRTILIALAGNVIIAIAKLGAGLITGSAAMLSEAAHSFADCINEVFLGISLKRSHRPPDPAHPLGYGRERFLWAFLAAMASFIIGGCVSIVLALRQFRADHTHVNQTWAWIILGIAFMADGASFLQSVDQAKDRARERDMSVWRYLVKTSDPILRAIVVEDSAALIGTLLAACGLLVSRILGTRLPDSVAALLIGVLLALTAIGLARPLADFLVGRSLPAPYVDQIQQILEKSHGIKEVIGVQAVYIGPEEAVVVAKILPGCNTVDELAKEMDDVDRNIKKAVPLVADVFIDVSATIHPDDEKR